PDGVLLRRHLLVFINLSRKIIGPHRDAEAGIGLSPNLRVGPVIALIDGGDIGKPAVRGGAGYRAFERLDREFMMLAAHRMPVIAGRGDFKDERLAPRACGGVELLNDLRARMLMHLVDSGEMHVEPV